MTIAQDEILSSLPCAWFKFDVSRKQKSSNLFAFEEEEFSTKKEVGYI